MVNKIKQIREAAHLSQGELASRLDVSQAAVANWERGVSAPTVTNLLALAQILDCTPNDLLGVTTP